MKHYVYVLKSKKDLRRYIGITSNIERRLAEHNAGKTRSTKHRIPFRLEYIKEYTTRSTARERERYLKTAVGRRFLNKVCAEMVELADTHV